MYAATLPLACLHAVTIARHGSFKQVTINGVPFSSVQWEITRWGWAGDEALGQSHMGHGGLVGWIGSSRWCSLGCPSCR